ncbi:tensin-3 isoform X3 [Leptopilina heterotoma]|uniref:tensin-3 isoform X3 n=1 Tax=Leptopilina heterotoma TaxID=63436 RepID=UPI001CA8391F|nr:tensin-3 isoform X3 [Leptopilina heterotoma]XP_043467305.1 tensin-3 isoform X3 [Leptopilina heterotoma]
MRTKIREKNLEATFSEARFRDTSQQIHKQWQTDPARAFPTVKSISSIEDSPTNNFFNQQNGTYKSQPKNVNTFARSSNGKDVQSRGLSTSSSSSTRTPGVGADSVTMGSGRSGRVKEVMELCYVTERIIALWYREDELGALEHATSLLRGKHANNYLIFNLSSPYRSRDPNTRQAGWPQGLAPSLERLCSLCKDIDSWLNAAPNRVVVLHSRGSKERERLGVAVSAYMNYSSICGTNDQALDRFSMRKFLDDKIGKLKVPSHRRYIEYFSGLLSGSLRISPSPLFLTHVTVLGVPLFEPTGCRAFLKVYEGLTPVYTSDLYSVTNAREFTVNLGGLRLRGDILIKCYHREYSKQSRQVMFSLQFHTCVITESVVSFPRSELDFACDDPRCPFDSVMTLYFATAARRLDGPIPAPTPAVPHASAHHDPILHWDSYSNLEINEDGQSTPISLPPHSNSLQTSPRGLEYTCGPLDGSIYAVVHPPAGSGARGSPLTVSMDSGISSGPPQRSSPPEIQTGNQAHGDLDKLLHDMMLTVESMPDAPTSEYHRSDRNGSRSYSSHGSHPTSSNYSTLKDSYRSYGAGKDSSSYSTLKNEYIESPSARTDFGRVYDAVDFRGSPDRKYGDSFSPVGNIDFIDDDIPYHARQTSQPFSYGATSDMIKHQKLSSPSLVRKASAPVVDINDILGESTSPISPLNSTSHEPPTEFTNGSIKHNMEHIDGLSWLRQQQLKLAARKDERNPSKIWRLEAGNRMLGELRNVQRSRLRHDGYASDSAILDDEDDNWTSSPISVQRTSAPSSPLLPQRSSSIGNSTLGRSRAEVANERPFVAIKRAYDFRKYHDNQSPSSLPAALIAAPSAGLINHYQNFNRTQPPRPEMRSDSFARAETLLKEYRLFNNFHTESVNMQNNQAHESKDTIPRGFGIHKSESEDAGLLTIVDQSGSLDDSLESHIHSLVDVSSLRGSPTTNKTVQLNLVSSDTPIFNTMISTTNSTPNQSPNAWQSSVQSHNDSSSWTERSTSPGASRPQTPAFPVPRTPYVNTSPTVTFASDRNYITPNINDSGYNINNNHIDSGIGNMNNNYVNRAIFIEERRDASRHQRLPPKSPTIQRKPEELSVSQYALSGVPTHFEFTQSPKSATSYNSMNNVGPASIQVQYYTSRRSSIHSNTEPQEVADVNVKFVRDTSKIWYKPNISREQAISMLKDATPGTFVVRDSNSFPGGFGLALKVATPPPGAPSCELVRHFLIEPTSRGVRLKGCANEPVFSSLSALVYQHSLMAMALPIQLLLPEPDATQRSLDSPGTNSAQQLLAQGAACNVLYLFTLDTESLTGPQAIKKTIAMLFNQKPLPIATIVHFKVSTQGITLTDNARKLFFRRHYPTNNISYCGLDPDERSWNFISEVTGRALSAHRCFGFIARKPAHKSDNQCHIFAELEPEQPAVAIVNFVNKVMMGNAQVKANIV